MLKACVFVSDMEDKPFSQGPDNAGRQRCREWTGPGGHHAHRHYPPLCFPTCGKVHRNTPRPAFPHVGKQDAACSISGEGSVACLSGRFRSGSIAWRSSSRYRAPSRGCGASLPRAVRRSPRRGPAGCTACGGSIRGADRRGTSDCL